jgi:ABC-type multidrug transport system fused ATPase/permease subunit
MDPDDLLGKAYDSTIVRRLFGFVTPYRTKAILTLLAIVVATISDLLLPALFSWGIDEISGDQRTNVINLLGAIFVVTLAVRFAATWSQFYLISWLGNRVVFDIRNKMFRHLQTLSVSYIDRRGVGSIMSRLQNDVGVINEFFADGLTGIFSNVLILIGIVVLMFFTNWELALITFIVMPIMIALMRVWRRRAVETYRATRRTMAIVNGN